MPCLYFAHIKQIDAWFPFSYGVIICDRRNYMTTSKVRGGGGCLVTRFNLFPVLIDRVVGKRFPAVRVTAATRKIITRWVPKFCAVDTCESTNVGYVNPTAATITPYLEV